MATTEITVVICTYNGSAGIAETLEAVQGQISDVPFRVLVVDDGSADGSAEIAERAGVEVIRHGRNRGLGAARQTALEALTTPYVAFTDDDCLPAPTWLAELWRARCEQPDAGCWGGTTLPEPAQTLVDRYSLANNPWAPLSLELARSARPAYRLWLYLKRNIDVEPVVRGPVFSLVGANMMFSVDELKSVGGFDGRFVYGGEDEEAMRRLRESGRMLWYTPDAIVRHRPIRTMHAMLKRSAVYGRGNARLFATGKVKTPTLYPIPLGMLAGSVPCAKNPRWLALWLAIPLVVYPRWLRLAVRQKSPEPMAYAYLQLAQETTSNAGWGRYLIERIASRRDVPETPDTASDSEVGTAR